MTTANNNNESTEFEIVPQSVLKDDDAVYQYLGLRLDTAVTIKDLIPFVEKLVSVQSLKQFLRQQLQEQYEREQQQQTEQPSISVLRSLFISLFLFNGIPSDCIQANIFSFLPNSDFRTLPMLSHNFRYILKHFAFLYNHKNYCVQLQFLSFRSAEMRLYRTCQKQQQDIQTVTLCRANHHAQHPNVSICARLNEHANILIMHNKQSSPPAWINGQQLRNMNEIDELSVPVSSISDWVITHNNYGRRSHIVRECNEQMFVFLWKSHAKLESVTLEDWNLDAIFDLLHGNKEQKQELRFSQCICFRLVSAKYASTKQLPAAKLNYHAMFSKLQCIELVNQHYETDEAEKTYEYIAQVMQSLSESVSLQCVCIVGSRRFRRPERSLCRLHIPRKVQWLSIHIAEYDVDLSACTDLIGLQLDWLPRSNMQPAVQWPSTDYLISFLGANCPLLEDVLSEQCNVKFLYNYRRNKQIRLGLKHNQQNLPGPTHVHLSIKQYMTMRQNDKAMEDAKCILLSKYIQTDESLLDDLLRYHFGNDGHRQHALQTYRKWWSVRHALWLKRIHATTIVEKVRRSVPVFKRKTYYDTDSSSDSWSSDNDDTD